MASIVVIEPWYGGSHQVWLDGWMDHSRHDIATLTLPDRFWKWRMRGGAVALGAAFDAHVDTHGRPDAVVVSGLIDAAAFAGLARRSLGDTPMALYAHENQVLYPLAPNQRPEPDLGFANWRSLLAADAIWWNSGFHRDALLGALPELLDRQPEPTDPAALDRVRHPSTVLWPGVDVAGLIAAPRPQREAPLVLWNQRWDHDKNPHAVFSALASAANNGIAFEVALAGENHGHSADGRTGLPEQVRSDLGSRIVHEGWLEPDAYRALLTQADVVVSAADHEFFGIALVEAMAGGAIPVLPDRLSFPELVGPEWHDAALYPDGDLRRRVEAVLRAPDEWQRRLVGLRESMARFDVTQSAAAHDAAVDQLVSGRSANS